MLPTLSALSGGGKHFLKLGGGGGRAFLKLGGGGGKQDLKSDIKKKSRGATIRLLHTNNNTVVNNGVPVKHRPIHPSAKLTNSLLKPKCIFIFKSIRKYIKS